MWVCSAVLYPTSRSTSGPCREAQPHETRKTHCEMQFLLPCCRNSAVLCYSACIAVLQIYHCMLDRGLILKQMLGEIEGVPCGPVPNPQPYNPSKTSTLLKRDDFYIFFKRICNKCTQARKKGKAHHRTNLTGQNHLNESSFLHQINSGQNEISDL